MMGQIDLWNPSHVTPAIDLVMPHDAIRDISLTTASGTLFWGGCALALFAVFALAFPETADVAMMTPLHIHNLDALGLPFALAGFTVVGGMTSFVTTTLGWRQRLLNGAVAVRPAPIGRDSSAR